MRIVFIGQKGIPAIFGGIEYHVDELSRGLAERGHDVRVYVRNWYTDRRIKSVHGIRLIHLPTVRSKHLDASVHSLLASIHSVFGGADIVHYHAIGPALFSWIPRIFGKKVVCTVHRKDWQAEKWKPAARAFLKLGERASILFPHRTIVVSRILQDYFREKYRKHTAYVPHGSFEIAPREPSLIRVKHGLKGKDYILFLGRLVPEKRVDLLIRAYRELKRTSPEIEGVKLIIAGGSSATDAHVRSLKALSEEEPDIHFVGFVSGAEKEELLTNALIFALPSSLEGFPIALLEAKSSGLFCLVSDISPHREAIREGRDGFFFRLGDASDLARKLLAALRDKDGLSLMKRGVRDESWKPIPWAEACSLTERIYREVRGRPIT
jgi:glycosyltransferase involved in cell wall biosynthesis